MAAALGSPSFLGRLRATGLCELFRRCLTSPEPGLATKAGSPFCRFGMSGRRARASVSESWMTNGRLRAGGGGRLTCSPFERRGDLHRARACPCRAGSSRGWRRSADCLDCAPPALWQIDTIEQPGPRGDLFRQPNDRPLWKHTSGGGTFVKAGTVLLPNA